MIRSSYSQVIPNLAYSYQDRGTGPTTNPLNYSSTAPPASTPAPGGFDRILSEYENPAVSPGDRGHGASGGGHKDGTEIEYCGGMMTHVFDRMRVYEHGGADAAHRAQLLWIPEKELEIVLLSNTTTYMAARAAKKLAADPRHPL